MLVSAEDPRARGAALLRAGAVGDAAALLEANALAAEAAPIRALLADDLELAVAHLLERPTAPRHELAVTLATLTCAGLVRRGGRDDRLLAVAAMRSALDVLAAEPAGSAAIDAWARQHGLSTDAIAIAEAIVRLAGRRTDAAFAALLAPHVAVLGDDVFETSELLAIAAAAALGLIEAGDRDFCFVKTYLLNEARLGRSEAARRHLTTLLSSPSRGLRPVYATVMKQAEARVAALGRLGEGGDALLPALRGVRTIALGAFTIDTGTVVVSDPCYEGVNGELQLVLRDVARGPWLARRLEIDHESGPRTAFLIAEQSPPRRFWQAKHRCPADAPLWRLFREAGIGVDSGQAGLFDIATYRDSRDLAPRPGDDDPWYDRVRALTATPLGGGVLAHGCVAKSGLGDGAYGASVAYDERGRIIGIAIDFGLVPSDVDAGDDA